MRERIHELQADAFSAKIGYKESDEWTYMTGDEIVSMNLFQKWER